MDTKKLRQKILDLAIHGKLVPQDPNDEPASVLLERIRAEKERLIAEGKIKRSKKSATSDTSHYENVPEGWVLTDIGELLTNRDSERVPLSLGVRSKQENKIYDYYGATGVVDKVDGYLFDERLLLIGEDGANLLSRSKDNAFFAEGKYWVNNHAHILDCPEKEVLDYVAFLINSMSLEDYITGSAQPKLNQDNLNKIEIPLPPLEEQRRIIAQVNLWQRCLMELETSENELNESVESAKSKILDLAIHGKLVPQDANDEPASELLKRINPKAVASCDNPHYENVPNGWIMLKGKYLFESMKSTKPTEEFFKYIDIDSIDNRIGIVTAPKVLPSQNAPSRASRYTCKGDVLFSMVRPYLRNIAIVPENNCIASTGFFVCHPIPVMTAEFCYFLMKSSYIVDGLNQFMKGDNSPSINNANITDWIYPIPPLEEQNRIVQKIKKLYGTIDCIAEALL